MEKREACRLLCNFLSGREIPHASLAELSPVDWEGLVALSQYSRVAGLFYRQIKSRNIPAGLIPDAVRNRLKEEYRNRAVINMNLFFDAAGILASLAGNQVPVIALKGLCLAKNIYGDIALRPMCDMDFLVKEEDLVKAGRILLDLGYRQDFPAWESTRKIYHHLPLFTNKRGTVIELHWDIVTTDSPIKVDLDGVWERARLIKVDALDALALSPEDLFLHLCIHACVHLETELCLIHLCDLAELIRTSAVKIDWRIVAERATRWGGQKCVYLVLLLVRELLEAAPPDEILQVIKPPDYRPVFLDEALRQVLDVGSSGQQAVMRINQLSNIQKMKGAGSRVSAFFRKAFPSKENLARMYPVPVSSPKIYLCYVFRLGRLIASYAAAFFRLFRRDQAFIKAVQQAQRASAVSDWIFSRDPAQSRQGACENKS
ncbi:MAG TPA: nucleotidyltransferase family protein [Patescibacteria group bacterium]|nr:nucleotidyltransferase family protein [Patescibacteria group bacterium]